MHVPHLITNASNFYTITHLTQPRLHFFFFNDTATTEIYTLSLHDALPICRLETQRRGPQDRPAPAKRLPEQRGHHVRSEEHTSELQSQSNLVCRLLLEKKKKKIANSDTKCTILEQIGQIHYVPAHTEAAIE